MIGSDRLGAIFGPAAQRIRAALNASHLIERCSHHQAEPPIKNAPRGALIIGAPTMIRTWDPQIRNLVLYPAELPGQLSLASTLAT